MTESRHVVRATAQPSVRLPLTAENWLWLSSERSTTNSGLSECVCDDQITLYGTGGVSYLPLKGMSRYIRDYFWNFHPSCDSNYRIHIHKHLLALF